MSGNLTAVGEMLGTKTQGKNLASEKWHKTVYCLLHICVHLDFAELVYFILVSDHALNCQELHIVWRVVTLLIYDVCSTPIYSFKSLKPLYHQMHTLMLTNKR